MTSSNRVRLALVRETTPGITPASPRMRTMRITGESLSFAPEYVDSDEIRDDRMTSDPIRVMQAATGGINFELSYPVDESPLSEIYRSAFFNPWVNTPQRDNDGVADAVVTGVATTTDVITVTTGPAFVAGHLVKMSGFAEPENNGVFKVTTGSATVPAVLGAGLADEAAPPATARVKVVGFQGASGDITAEANGLGSTALDFTTLGLAVGQAIKIGGTATGDKFATLANNGYARIIAISATLLTLDNLPADWATDVGTGKTIKVWFGDRIKNGVIQSALTLEKGFLGQTIPTYITNIGMTVGELAHTFTSRQKLTGSVTFTGMGGEKSATPLDASPDAVTTDQVMAANANVGRLLENGERLTKPNWAQEISFTINNNLRTNDAVDEASPVAVREGEATVTGRINTYFGDDSLLEKFYAGTPTSLFCQVGKGGKALVYQFPRVTYRGGGNPQAGGKNSDIMLALDFTASKDALTESQIMCDRLEYVE